LSGAGGLEDLERIYVDLENLEDAVDALAFEANVYTAGLTFASLEHAYIRLVNADTNQEVTTYKETKEAQDGTRNFSRLPKLIFRRILYRVCYLGLISFPNLLLFCSAMPLFLHFTSMASPSPHIHLLFGLLLVPYIVGALRTR